MSELSPCHSSCLSSSLNSHLSYFPCETLLHIFSYLPIEDVVSCVRTCNRWRHIINNNQTLWKHLCHTLDNSIQAVRKDRQCGYSWKECFEQNYGKNGIKKQWREGKFSQPSSYRDLPDIPFCHLDTDSWAQVLQWELDRL